jgi:hypothetical protein
MRNDINIYPTHLISNPSLDLWDPHLIPQIQWPIWSTPPLRFQRTMNSLELLFRPSHDILVRDYLCWKIRSERFPPLTACLFLFFLFLFQNLSTITVLSSDIGNILEIYLILTSCDWLYFFCQEIPTSRYWAMKKIPITYKRMMDKYTIQLHYMNTRMKMVISNFQPLEAHGIRGDQEDVQWTKIKEDKCMFLVVNVYIYYLFL